MRIDATIDIQNVRTAAQQAAHAESAGYAGFGVPETSHDPFLPLVQAAASTERIELSTGVAIAFARTPMTLANIGYDLAGISEGRFVLGLGSQIKPHITRRFSMPWSKPAARMREMILALQAIWANWHEGKPLRFRGEFYTHTLMTPVFTPPAHEWGPPRIRLAAVGELMTEVAGEVADGLICHGFTTAKYLAEVTLPAVEAGATRAGRSLGDVEVVGLPMVGVLGADRTDDDVITGLRERIAFYGSTPAYRPVLELHGWGSLGDELHGLSLARKWQEMGALLPDEVLETFAIIGNADEVGSEIERRYGSLVTRAAISTPGSTSTTELDSVVAALS
ncbi:TIGR03617 family F420-dependent LLM class oxidoreductase [Epidermidibacterium keratini]|uniref:TIGR03617 family F420-dependent LLM class oxidoreductase n=1 Tax=Epidermidibacterium keratini TaxID=1891644 RepID=A0A7L4YMT5_9ACTN|nr:TIGR03617 family F420-dependent LLM class oxidoreductase [Epidermidibacterium keratini]QHC00129.1 TIGR03617 family F420-dependent LLM class oxidoreductase [Epidermidibacterium keratini]